MQPTISFAVVGLVIGEAASMCVSLIAVKVHFNKILPIHMSALLCLKSTQFLSSFKELLSLAVPLSLNRVIINFLQSIEAIFIPQQLLKYGCSTSQALSVYGVLTGMALPLILFPGAITNSICVLLLPMGSEADAVGGRYKIAKAPSVTVSCSESASLRSFSSVADFLESYSIRTNLPVNLF